jgi:hypothetical protein
VTLISLFLWDTPANCRSAEILSENSIDFCPDRHKPAHFFTEIEKDRVGDYAQNMQIVSYLPGDIICFGIRGDVKVIASFLRFIRRCVNENSIQMPFPSAADNIKSGGLNFQFYRIGKVVGDEFIFRQIEILNREFDRGSKRHGQGGDYPEKSGDNETYRKYGRLPV